MIIYTLSHIQIHVSNKKPGSLFTLYFKKKTYPLLFRDSENLPMKRSSRLLAKPVFHVAPRRSYFNFQVGDVKKDHLVAWISTLLGTITHIPLVSRGTFELRWFSGFPRLVGYVTSFSVEGIRLDESTFATWVDWMRSSCLSAWSVWSLHWS